MIPRRIILNLVTAALVLPIAISVLVAVAWTVARMDDGVGALVLRRIALAGGILWLIDLVCLVTILGIQALMYPRDPPLP